MKQILLITNDLNYSKGGQELANRHLLTILKKYKIKIINLQFQNESDFYDKVLIDKNINLTRNFWLRWIEIAKALQSYKKENIDLVIISAVPFTTLISLMFMKVLNLYRNKKIIYYSHVDPYNSLIKSSRITRLLYILSHLLYKYVDIFVVTNTDMGKIFEEKFNIPIDKIELIPYPLRPDFFKMIQEQLNINLDKYSRPFFGTITRLEIVQKDPITLLRSFKLFRDKYKKGTLIIAGSGSKENYLKSFCTQLNIDKYVLFLGFIKNPAALLKMIDFFVLSTKMEGTPIVLIEAQAAGIPIISSDCPTGPKWVLENGKAGILVSVGNDIKLYEAMMRLYLDQPSASNLVKHGYKLSKRHQFVLIKEKWLKLIRYTVNMQLEWFQRKVTMDNV